MPTNFSLFEINGNLTLSVLKKAEERSGYILRLYNGLLDEVGHATITFNHPVNVVETVNLKEAKKEALLVENNAVTLEKIDHAKFVTLYVE